MTPAAEFAILRNLQRYLRLCEVAFQWPWGLVWMRNRVLARMAKLAPFLCLVALCGPAAGQHGQHHAQGHDFYKNWQNKNDVGCCDNRDCDKLADADERMSRGVIEVRVGDQWCPVLPHHYLKKGNSPDWSVSHACIRPHTLETDTSICDRLLCYQPRPGT
jgi:hypothetical protein